MVPDPPLPTRTLSSPKMWAYRTNNRHIGDTTKTNLALAAVDFAVARAECAGIHAVPQLLDGFAKRV